MINNLTEKDFKFTQCMAIDNGEIDQKANVTYFTHGAEKPQNTAHLEEKKESVPTQSKRETLDDHEMTDE